MAMTQTEAIETLKSANLLPKRWTRLPRIQPVHIRLIDCRARFVVVPAGRRSYKTELAKRKLITVARDPKASVWDNPRYFAGAPTRDQAKRIFWDDLKKMMPPREIDGKPSETELTIKTVFGSSISVVGLDKPERIEGSPWDGGILDEYGNMRSDTWGEHVRPALADRNGWCWLIGVPEGRNHYYQIAEYAKNSGDPDWMFFTWYSSDVLPPEEIEAARKQLDEKTFRQEFEASFESYEGLTYYSFDSKLNCDDTVCFDRNRPLVLRHDFNRTPMTCTIAQEHETRQGWVIHVIDEITINSSNTAEVAQEILNRYDKLIDKNLGADVYGDAYGDKGTTGKTDYQILDEMLRAHQWHVRFHIPESNPLVVDRVNAVNAMLKTGAGIVRTKINPSKCPQLVKDFEQVVNKEGTRIIDKDSDPMRTHWSDGHGYHVALRFPIREDKRY